MDPTSSELIHILPFVAVGFAAQVVDGALGMAFGVISNTLLISLAYRPPQPRRGCIVSKPSRPPFRESAMRSIATSTGGCSCG